MRGDNAKTINPEPKAQRAKRQRARVDNACDMLGIQLDKARAGTHATRVEALRGMLKTLLLTLPYEASMDKKVTLSTVLLESAYNDEDEFYDMPHVDMDMDSDLVSIHGNFSFKKLAKRIQW
jgi:hypothetical protein